MSFAKQAASAVVNHTERRELCKLARQVVLAQAYDDDEEERSNWGRNLLWTLGGLGALAGGGYLAHRTGALNWVGDKARQVFGGDSKSTQKGLVQRGAEAVSDIPVGWLGAAGAANAVRGMDRAQRVGVGRRGHTLGARGLARQLRQNAPDTEVKGTASRGFFRSLFEDPARGEQEFARTVQTQLGRLPQGVEVDQLAEQLERRSPGRTRFGLTSGRRDLDALANTAEHLTTRTAGMDEQSLRTTAQRFGVPVTEPVKGGGVRVRTADEIRGDLQRTGRVIQSYQRLGIPADRWPSRVRRFVAPLIISKAIAPAVGGVMSMTGADRPSPPEEADQ